MGRMRCLKGLGDWKKLNYSCQDLLDFFVNNETADGQQNSLLNKLKIQEQDDYKAKIAEMGAAACWGLGDWNQMQTYVTHLPENSYNGSLYKSVLALTLTGSQNKDKLNALPLIEHTRDLLDADLTSMASQSYERSYQAIIESQVNKIKILFFLIRKIINTYRKLTIDTPV